MIRHYWTLSRKDGTPQDARQRNRVKNTNLDPKAAQGFRSETELMSSSWLLGVIVDRETHGAPDEWDAVQIDGDGDSEIIAPKRDRVGGVFVNAFGELQRLDLRSWIGASAQSENSELAQAARMPLMSIEVEDKR